MAGLIANGICRYAVDGEYAGRQVINILDMKIDTTGTDTPRDEACFLQAGDILNAWDNHVLDNILVDNYVAQAVSWVDLDEADGSTGARSATEDHSWPKAGYNVETAMPGNVAIRVNKLTKGGRGTKRGRMYLCGCAENMTTDGSPNNLNSGSVIGVNAALANFLTDITREGAVTNVFTSQLHVVHTRTVEEGPPRVIQFVSSSEVNGLLCDTTLGSQRRRLR